MKLDKTDRHDGHQLFVSSFLSASGHYIQQPYLRVRVFFSQASSVMGKGWSVYHLCAGNESKSPLVLGSNTKTESLLVSGRSTMSGIDDLYVVVLGDQLCYLRLYL